MQKGHQNFTVRLSLLSPISDDFWGCWGDLAQTPQKAALLLKGSLQGPRRPKTSLGPRLSCWLYWCTFWAAMGQEGCVRNHGWWFLNHLWCHLTPDSCHLTPFLKWTSPQSGTWMLSPTSTLNQWLNMLWYLCPSSPHTVSSLSNHNRHRCHKGWNRHCHGDVRMLAMPGVPFLQVSTPFRIYSFSFSSHLYLPFTASGPS